MNEKQFQSELIDIIFDAGDNSDDHANFADAQVYTGVEYGLMTNNAALVIKLANGQVFQLTIQERR